MDVDLRQVRQFVAVAEELNFTRAAERLHITQQALSSQIQRLEARLGVQLLKRDTHGTELTAAGRTLLKEGKRTLQHAERTAELTKLAAEGKVGTLRVAFKAHALGHFAGELITTMRQQLPGVEFDLVTNYTAGKELELLRKRDVDAIFIWLPIEDPDVNAEVILEEPWVVALHPSHPLAASTSIEISEIANEPILGSLDTIPPEVLADRSDGHPAGVRNAQTAEECIVRVSAGDGIWIAPRSVRGYFSCARVGWVPLVGVEPARLAIGWRESSPLVHTVVAEYRRIVAQAISVTEPHPVLVHSGAANPGRKASPTATT